MRVRKATQDDEAAIVDELLVPSFEHDEAIDPSFNRLGDEAIGDIGCEYWLDPDGWTMFVAVERGELLGHVSGNEVAEPPIYRRNRPSASGSSENRRFSG